MFAVEAWFAEAARNLGGANDVDLRIIEGGVEGAALLDNLDRAMRFGSGLKGRFDGLDHRFRAFFGCPAHIKPKLGMRRNPIARIAAADNRWRDRCAPDGASGRWIALVQAPQALRQPLDRIYPFPWP